MNKDCKDSCPEEEYDFFCLFGDIKRFDLIEFTVQIEILSSVDNILVVIFLKPLNSDSLKLQSNSNLKPQFMQ